MKKEKKRKMTKEERRELFTFIVKLIYAWGLGTVIGGLAGIGLAAAAPKSKVLLIIEGATVMVAAEIIAVKIYMETDGTVEEVMKMVYQLVDTIGVGADIVKTLFSKTKIDDEIEEIEE